MRTAATRTEALRRLAGAAVLALASVLAGCDRAAAPAGSGAREAAHAYYEALLRRDWPKAYAALHPDSRKRLGGEQFAQRAQAYRRDLGFEAEKVHVRACEERGAEAVAHVTLDGRSAGKGRHYRDAVTLRRGDAGWGVVLAPNFGQGRPR